MTGFGDADKLAAAKELQRSFTTRSDTPRGSVRGGTTRGARASSTRGGLQPTASRGGFQSSPSSSSIRGRGGRGGRGGSATRGSFSPAVNSPSTSLTDVQHNTASRAASAQGLPGSATFGQLSTKYESNFGMFANNVVEIMFDLCPSSYLPVTRTKASVQAISALVVHLAA